MLLRSGTGVDGEAAAVVVSDVVHVGLLAVILALVAGGLIERHNRIEENEQSIRCLRATIALILDSRANLYLQTDPELGRRIAKNNVVLKWRLLEPRDCPALDSDS